MRNTAKIPAKRTAENGAQPVQLTAQRGGKATETPETPASAEGEVPTETPAVEVAPVDETPTVHQVETQTPPAVEATPEQPAPTVTGPAPLTEVLARVKRVGALQAKFDKLSEADASLSAFRFGASGYTDSLEIKDGYGRPFQTTKTGLIVRVMEMIRTDVASALAETEAEMRAELTA